MALTDADLILETGQALSTANTYVLRADAVAYHAIRGNEDWAAASVEEQVIALVRGADYLDRRWKFVGTRVSATQSLAWPRDNAYDAEGNDVSIEAEMTGDPGLTFDLVALANDTLLRDDEVGWTDDGFFAGQRIEIIGTVSNDDTFVIADFSTVTAPNDRMEFAGDVLADEVLAEGATIRGLDPSIPTAVKQAQMEYALRSLTGTLMPDPITDTTGGFVTMKREKVGPIEEETRYSETRGRTTIPPYPGADRILLLSGLVVSAANRSIRA